MPFGQWIDSRSYKKTPRFWHSIGVQSSRQKSIRFWQWISTRLYAVCLVITILALTSSGLAVALFAQQSHILNQVSSYDLPEVFLLEDMEHLLLGMSLDRRGFLLSGAERFDQRFDEKAQAFEQLMQRYEYLDAKAWLFEKELNDHRELDEQQELQTLRQTYQEWQRIDQTIETLFRGDQKQAAIDLKLTVGIELRDQVIRHLERIVNSETTHLQSRIARTEAQSLHSRNTVLAVTVLMLVIGCGITTLMIRSITIPLSQLQEAAHAVAQGRLETPVTTRTQGEIGRLSRSIEQMRLSLLQTITSLTAQRAKLATTLKFSADAVLVLSRDRHVVLFNPAAERLLGISMEQALGQPYLSILRVIGPSESHEAAKQLNALLNGGCKEQHSEIQLQCANGKMVWVGLSCGIAPPSGYVLVLRDISKTKALDELRSTFISTVSHELRRPLTSIVSAIELLSSNQDLNDEEQHSVLNILAHEAGQLRMLVDNVLNTMRLEADRFTVRLRSTNISQLLDDVVAPYRHRLQTIPIWLGMPDIALIAYADPVATRLVLNNLIANALIHASGAQKIRITAQMIENHILVAVRDDGPGIAYEHQQRIFDRFYCVATEADSMMGSGLGLYIAYELIDRQGGRLWVKSAPNQGATFYFTLPRLPKIGSASGHSPLAVTKA